MSRAMLVAGIVAATVNWGLHARRPSPKALPLDNLGLEKVAPFDRGALETRLRELGVSVLPTPDEPGVVRFPDNNGIVVDVRLAQ